MLLKPESKSKLSTILTYHIVEGNFNEAGITTTIKKNKGMFMIKTLNGDILTTPLKGTNVVLTDHNENITTITTTDIKASNRVIH